jgi:ArsR family transcriptional regulator
MGISKANLSQHLAKMRESGILNSRKAGLNIFYSLANPKVTQACRLMKEVLREHFKEQDQMRKKIRF